MTVLTQRQLERQRTQSKATTAPGDTSAEPETIDIRARQAEIEREAETAKATIREVERKERRARELPLKPQRTKGIAGAVVEVEKARKEAHATGRVALKGVREVIAAQTRKIEGIAKYKSGEGYDLAMMIQDGYTPKQLTELGFASDVITKAQDRVAELAKADKYKGTDGYNLVAMVNDGYTQSQLESLFGKDAAGEAITRADVITRASKYKTDAGYDVAAMVRDNFPQSDMSILFDSQAISHAQQIVALDSYKSGDGYDFMKIFENTSDVVRALGGPGAVDSDLPNLLMGLGFTEASVKEAEDTYAAMRKLSPYKLADGTYDLVAISKAVSEGKLSERTVTFLFGENPPQYLTVAQVAQIRLATPGQAYMMGDAWGVSNEQVDQIRAAPDAVYSQVYAYLQKNAPSSIELTHPSQLPSFQQTPDWKELASALQDVEPYKVEGGQYDVAKAYQDMIAGKLSKTAFILAFGQDTYSDTKAFYNANVEIKPGEWVAKTEWQALTPAQQREVIATGNLTTLDTTGLVKLDTGEYITAEDWGKLDAPAQSYLKEHGIDKFNADFTAPSQGWLKDTWAGIKAAMVVTDKTKENATAYCKSLGITDQKVIDGAAQWIQLSRMFIPRPTADPHTDPKGYLIETGKAIAAYAPIAWVVNWKTMSVTDRIINGAIDVVTFATLGLGAGLRALRARPVLKAATAAGRAASKMDNALRVLAKTPMDDVARYTKASSTASKAIQASKVADTKFVTALERVKSLTSKQLTQLEKASQVKGLKGAILDVSNAQTELAKAWKPITTYRPDVRAGASTLEERAFMGSKSYIKRMARVERAQTALNKALETFNAKLEPRFKVNPTPEFKGFATQWHKKVLPVFEGGDTIISPLGGGKGVQLAVLEKTKPKLGFKTFYEIKLKPVRKVATETAKKVAPPAIKGSKVAKATVAATEAAKAATKVERDIRYGSGQVQRVVEGQTTIAIGKVMQGVTGKNQPVTARDWNTKQAIEQITKGAVVTGIDASTKNVTSTQLQDLIATDIAQSVRDIPDIRLRTAIQPQTQAITRLVTKLVTKVVTKYGNEIKQIKRIRTRRSTAKETDKEGRPIYPKGTVVFRMGKTKRGAEYKAMLPPYDQAKLVSSTKPPVGIKRTEGTPEQTLTVIGDKKLPFGNLSADIGITDVFVDTRRKKIRFAPGLHTNVGQRIPSNTRGVSLANNMRVTRQGQIFYTQLRGQRGVAMSRHNPRRRRGRKV